MRAAIDVISDKGYNETRLDDIATLAEITTPAIYKHYKNKEDILFLTTLVNSNQFIEQLEQDLLGVHGPTNLIRKLIWAYLDQCQRNPPCLQCRHGSKCEGQEQQPGNSLGSPLDEYVDKCLCLDSGL